MTTEEWRLIYDGYYSVSNLGRVRRERPGRATKAGRMCKLTVKRGYPTATLSRPGVKARQRFLHHLVAEAFIGARPKGAQVDHLDTDKLNSRADNLEYVSSGENSRRAWRVIMARRQMKIDAIIAARLVTP